MKNFKMKTLAVASWAALGLAGQALALTQSTVGNPGSMFLFVFEDRALNPSASNSAVFDLGLSTDFSLTTDQTFDFSADSAWTTYIATITNPANIKWGVFGAFGGGNSTGDDIYTTLSDLPDSNISGTNVNTAVAKMNTVIGAYNNTGAGCDLSLNCGYATVTLNDAASGTWGNTAGGARSDWLTTAGLGESMSFFSYEQKGTKNTAPRTDFLGSNGVDLVTFELSSDGVLTYQYTAPVPEADSILLVLAGLGLLGYMARRRAGRSSSVPAVD